MTRALPVLLVVGLLSVPVLVSAAPRPAASASPTATDDRARDAGVIDGRVISIDYARGRLTVGSSGQGKVDVTTMPSTSVQSDDPGYHGLTDVAKGSHVQIFASKSAGKLIAQIIKLLKR
ncbi:MAG: hypothetical protein JOZ24_11390 [Candidatus Eremiobacteraeota bacterium]|nr:hypothetical protein [Candidatus Eremiobacteraeota bacterium]